MNQIFAGARMAHAASASASACASGATRRRLAIISTYDELCGIAGYTRALEIQLQDHFEVTVLDLDQYLLRSPHRSVQKLADRHIRELAAQLRDYDAVNIQLEHGTLGLTPQQIIRRFRRLCRAAPALSVTFHTILSATRFDWGGLLAPLSRLRLREAARIAAGHVRATMLANGINRFLRVLQRRKPVRIIVHTKRDMRLMRDVFGLRDVLHHPLSFVTPAERERTLCSAQRHAFPLLRVLPADAQLVGVFGFVSEYKGFDTAIRALRLLPENHHLLLFGGIHPQTIRKHVPIDPYLRKLLDTAYIDRSLFDEFASGTAGGASVQLALGADCNSLLDGHPRSLLGRVHFMGALNDRDFVAAMAVCNAVVMSYLEVGQSASGPIAQALEMGCRVIASRTNTFLQYAKYHPGQFEFFDIGNHLELAERLAADSPIDCGARQLAYDCTTNAAVYVQANTPARVHAAARTAAARTAVARVPA